MVETPSVTYNYDGNKRPVAVSSEIQIRRSFNLEWDTIRQNEKKIIDYLYPTKRWRGDQAYCAAFRERLVQENLTFYRKF